MRWRLLAVVVLLSTIAGCGALVGADESPTRETLTPAPVPEHTPTPERWPVAPGLSGDGVADVDALVAAHLEAVTDRSFVWRERRGTLVEETVSSDNASVPVFDLTVARVESPTVYRVWTGRERVRLESGPRFVANYTEYADGRVRHARYRLVGDSRYRVQTFHAVSAARSDYIGAAAARAIRRYLSVDSATVAPTRVEGRRYYEVVARQSSLAGPPTIRNYTVRAVVSQDGFVRSLDVSYVTIGAGAPRRVQYAFEYERVNETTVDPPSWYEGETPRSVDAHSRSQSP